MSISSVAFMFEYRILLQKYYASSWQRVHAHPTPLVCLRHCPYSANVLYVTCRRRLLRAHVTPSSCLLPVKWLQLTNDHQKGEKNSDCWSHDVRHLWSRNLETNWIWVCAYSVCVSTQASQSACESLQLRCFSASLRPIIIGCLLALQNDGQLTA